MRDQIIKLLRNKEGYFSGEEISHQLNISRAGIWKNIEELRKEGYTIDAVTHKGYRLVSAPDKLVVREIQNNLKTQIIGNKIVHFESLDSTMDEASRLATEGVSEGMVVCAEQQTKGKGRLGRQWISPYGKGLYLSIILRPQVSPANVAQITLLSAVAICEAIRNLTLLDVGIKWPNDILLHDKKISGILTEMSAEMDRVRFVIVGIGINVNTSNSSLPENATSLKEQLNKKVSRINLIQEVLRVFDDEYQHFLKEGFDSVIDKWKSMSVTLGKQVELSNQNSVIKGVATDLDPLGGLMIKQDDGVVIKRMSGDVEHVS